mmetsp:Transcript_71079/g.208326  ORF Transcript_71079/g.208326 Transcript_71079/m.208326 type:complete len:82 (-) Transcript_71079:974-1219(-)
MFWRVRERGAGALDGAEGELAAELARFHFLTARNGAGVALHGPPRLNSSCAERRLSRQRALPEEGLQLIGKMLAIRFHWVV